MFTVNRSEHNPILSPEKNHPWEAAAVFNGCPVVIGKNTFLIYRAMSEPEKLKEPHIRTSVIGRAVSKDTDHFSERSVLVGPSESFDQFGCEDPRVTKLGGMYYIFYTGLGGYPFHPENVRVAVAVSKDLKTVKEKHSVTPFNSKAMAMFPEKINGKIATLLTVNPDRPPSEICYAEFDRPEEIWSENYWKDWEAKGIDSHKLSVRRLPDDHLELGAAPVKTKKGWLVLYSHMQKYGNENQVFGTEFLLLDLKNPRKIIGRTKGPFIVADAYYETTGLTSNVIFPSGLIIKGKNVEIYYGAADTHCAKASINLENLLASLSPEEAPIVKRFPGNPILAPRPKMAWEEKGVFNPAAIDLDGRIHLLYRAVSQENISTLGYASTLDGFSIEERSKTPIYSPREGFEISGCEDPRLVGIGEKIYMTYTAYDGSTPRVAISSIDKKDFSNKKWIRPGGGWARPFVITPEGIANKDAAIIPEKFNNKYFILHRVGESICAYPLSSLDFSKEKVNECIEIIGPRRGMWDGVKVGVAAPAVKTKSGWLLLYHGVSWSGVYRVGAVLLDPADPTNVISRSAGPIFEPEEEYEQKGFIPNVVFPCGLVVRKDTAYMYYGGADTVVGVATMKLQDILKILNS